MSQADQPGPFPSPHWTFPQVPHQQHGANLACRSSSPSYRPVLIPDGIGRATEQGWSTMSARIFGIRASSGRSAGPHHQCRRPDATDQIAFVRLAGAEHRMRYLANARIWSDPGDVTPEMVMAGRPLNSSRRNSRRRLRVSRCRAISPNQGERSAATRRNSRA